MLTKRIASTYHGMTKRAMVQIPAIANFLHEHGAQPQPAKALCARFGISQRELSAVVSYLCIEFSFPITNEFGYGWASDARALDGTVMTTIDRKEHLELRIKAAQRAQERLREPGAESWYKKILEAL